MGNLAEFPSLTPRDNVPSVTRQHEKQTPNEPDEIHCPSLKVLPSLAHLGVLECARACKVEDNASLQAQFTSAPIGDGAEDEDETFDDGDFM